MPVHAAAWALSSLLTVSVLLRAALVIVVLAVLRQGAHGIDPNRLLDRLIAESQAAAGEDGDDAAAANGEGAGDERARRADAGIAESEEEQLRRLNTAARERGGGGGGGGGQGAGKAAGPRRPLAPVRDLHGRVFLLASGGLDTPVGLQLADSLARRGAQLVLLDPRPLSHPAVLQLVHLLRSAHSGNGEDEAETPLVYAEQCDLADVRSVEAFVKKWEALLQPGGRAAGSGSANASDPLGLDPRTARTDGVDASSLTSMSSPARRLDSIIFLPPSPTYTLGSRRRFVRLPASATKDASTPTAKGRKAGADTPPADLLEVETEHALALGRLQLILSLVPSLTTLPRERDIRIVNAVGPWYAAASALVSRYPASHTQTKPGSRETDVPGFASPSLDWTERGPPLRFSPWSPHLPRALTDLTWLALSTYLQRRLDVLAGELAAARPGGLAMAGSGGGGGLGGVEQDAFGLTEEQMASHKSRSNLRVLTVSLGFERAHTFGTFLPSSPPSSSSSFWPAALHVVWVLLRALVWLVFQPLSLLLLRSSTHAANEVLWAIRAPIRAGFELLPSPHTRLEGQVRGASSAVSPLELRRGEAVVPGKLHYQGDVIRTPLPPALQSEDALRTLYRQEEARAREIVAHAAPLPAAE